MDLTTNIIKVDLDVLDSTIRTYKEAIEKMEIALNETTSIIEKLKVQEWKTEGSKAFFQKYDDEWSVNFNEHLLCFRHLLSCLKTARKEYYDVYSEGL